ncbi:CsbD family protein [Arthrobacter sp. MDB2-24]
MLAGHRNRWLYTESKEVRIMGLDDKIGNKSEGLGGKIKEGLGKASGDENLEAEGHKDQASSSLKDAGENIKDAFKGR